jgi:hypothetical protein
MATLSCPKKSQVIYRPRRPEKTVLFDVVKKHYKTWHKNAEGFVPGYVNREFQKYLECGILAKGFAHAHCDGCHKDFFIAFSCKGRGICPSCNTRAMVETAANLIENVIPRVPVRQFVMSFPMRIRHYLETHAILQSLLKIVVDEIRKRVIICSPDAANAQIGAVSFIQHFGNALNVHPHFHILVADGIFSGAGEDLLFHAAMLAPDDIADIQDCIQKRVLKFFGKRGWFDQDTVEKMLSYENAGFSLDALVKTESWDRAGLERLIRYCARPSFASENLRLNGPWLTYRLPKPSRTGQICIQLQPLEFIEKIAAFIPYPRRHRRHYHGVFAPGSPVRKKVAANAQKARVQVPPEVRETTDKVGKVSFNWAKLIARIYETDPLICSSCGKKIKIIAFVIHAAQIRRILSGIGLPTVAPEFDLEYDTVTWDICQLEQTTLDGFPEFESQAHSETGPDPPHCDDYSDPPHWEDNYHPSRSED